MYHAIYSGCSGKKKHTDDVEVLLHYITGFKFYKNYLMHDNGSCKGNSKVVSRDVGISSTHLD